MKKLFIRVFIQYTIWIVITSIGIFFFDNNKEEIIRHFFTSFFIYSLIIFLSCKNKLEKIDDEFPDLKNKL